MADYSVGQAFLTVLPSLAGFGEDVRRQLAEQDLSATVDVKPELDASELDARIAEIKAELDELSGKDIELGADDADAKAKIDLLKAELDDLQAKRAEIKIKADDADAIAKMDEVKLKADELDGKTATVKVKADTSEANSGISALGIALVGLGSAVVPIAAAAGAGLAGLAGGAVFAAAGMGVLKLATSGVGGAITAVETAQQQQGQNAAQVASQQISAANSVANAQDSLRAAVANVGVAQETAARSVASAQEQEQAAIEATDVAEQNAARSVAAAVEQQQQAEQSLTDAVRAQTQAQQALTQARIDAQNALINSTLSIQDNALAQRAAQLQLEQAQQNLTTLSPTATGLQRQQAQLAVDQAQQQIRDTAAQGQQLAQQNATLAAQGVNGSQQVTAAQNAIYTANEQVANAQTRVKDTTTALAQAQSDGARQISDALRHQADSVTAVDVAEETGARQVAQAKQAVVTATRALQDAEAAETAALQQQNQALTAAQQALANLSPAQREFVNFVIGLRPQITALKQAAAGGLLPGVEDGIKALLPTMPQITGLVGAFSVSLGDLARNTGQALASPTWTGFISFLQGEAGPSFREFGTIVGNLATGAVGLIEAFKPVWDEMGVGLEHLTADFADFGQHAGSNSDFQKLLAYVEQEGPVVVHTLLDFGGALLHIGQALAPIGSITLTVIDDFLKLIDAIPTPYLTPLLGVLISGYLAWQGWKIITTVTGNVKDFAKAIIALPGQIRTLVLDITNLLVKWGLLSGVQSTSILTVEEQTTATTANTAAQETNTVATEERDVALSVTAVDLDALTASEGAATIGLEAETAATDTATVATGALDVAMDANPIGLVITALTALVLIVIEVYQHFDTLKAIALDVWNAMGTAVKWTWDNILSPVLNFLKGLAVDVGNAFSDMASGIGKTWGALGNIVKAPVNFVIDPIYDKGIVGVWNAIAGVFGLGTLAPIATLATGGVLPGYSPGRDTVPAMLSPGEGVLVPEAVRALGSGFVHWANAAFTTRSGVAAPGHYSLGGIIGDIGSAIAGLFTDPVGTIAKLFADVTGAENQIPGSGTFRSAMADIPEKVVAAVVDKAKSYVASAAAALTGSIGGGVEQWRATGLAALAAEGQNPAANIGYLLAQMTTESGGNPTIVNTTDSNWVAGTPSVGLMQVIGPTYAAFKDLRFDKGPYEYGTSVDPMANITAAIRYALNAYGSLASIWGQGHGYDSGGWLPPGTSLVHNGTRAPEAVLTGDQWTSLSRHIARPAAPISINVYPRAEHSEVDIANQVSRQLALAMRSHL